MAQVDMAEKEYVFGTTFRKLRYVEVCLMAWYIVGYRLIVRVVICSSYAIKIRGYISVNVSLVRPKVLETVQMRGEKGIPRH